MKAVDEIRRELGEETVSTDPDDIEYHAFSDFTATNATEMPIAVVRPESTEQVSTIAKICTKYRVPMTPFGARSSVEGNFSSPYSGVCIDFCEMNKIIQFNPQDMDVVVEAGVNWMALNEEIKDSGLFLPPDPGPAAYIGGMVATNCSGTNAMRYGTMKDYVVNLTVVLADGTIIKTRQRPRKTSAGYNLNSLFTGSEGTLGIVTQATLKLAVLPTNLSIATAAFGSIHAAAAAANTMVLAGLPLTALELMDEAQMRTINQTGGTAGKMWVEGPTLFLKFSGTKSSVKDSAQAAQAICRQHGASTFDHVYTPKEMDQLWSARKLASLALVDAKPKDALMSGTDVAVPISRMADLIEESKAKATGLGLTNSVLGHVGDGNFHQALYFRPDETDKLKDCLDTMVQRAVEMEGTVTEGLLKELGPTTVGVMKALKDTLDPHWLLNPGKVFDE
ncbi:FAD-binding domain-containing protein [Trichoderma citrinoviride]|uniref:D-lactate dehydrogenase (cytochrome) n=1 Tax=Trichoderma citrinoviride TaxID=58853 RepID=A0A2T4BCW0_9HYPO|nr:FAD-binding domain-containing protein [Trichoderma citrinoviride]PTB67029.1 FAD-binding domain-containing protein [Trichoderma citrinoviride]